jgi:hypothetical protein
LHNKAKAIEAGFFIENSEEKAGEMLRPSGD